MLTFYPKTPDFYLKSFNYVRYSLTLKKYDKLFAIGYFVYIIFVMKSGHMGAKKVYKFLGVEDKLLWYFRSGGHFHTVEDIKQLVNVIRNYKYYL